MSATSLAARLQEHAAATPDAVALSFEGHDLDWVTLWNRIGRATTRLREDWSVRRGERVAVLAHNHPDQIVLLAALMRLEAILVPLNWRLAPEELKNILRHAGASLLLADAAHATVAAGLGVIVRPLDALAGAEVPASADPGGGAEAVHDASVAPDAAAPSGNMGAVERRGAAPIDAIPAETPCLLVYTSGTTGVPKGAVHTVGGLYWNARASQAMHGFAPQDTVLTVLPLFHVGGLCIQTLPALYAGARVILHPRFDPGAWLDAIARDRPTISLMVPATMRAAIDHPRWAASDLSSLRLLGAGSSTIPEALILAFHARRIPVCQIYGATETGPVSIVLGPAAAFERVGAAGWPARGCEVRLVGDNGDLAPTGVVGEVWVRGPNVMRGYWREPGHPAFRYGWFHTGDLARCDESGCYTIVGRSKELIISGGENIYPAEIENLLADMPEIAEATVIGLPDPRWGEVPVAVVVLRAGAALSADGLLARFEGRLARFKLPRRVVFRATLPRNAMAKVLKAALIDELQAGPGSP